jgi:hypothetical protein
MKLPIDQDRITVDVLAAAVARSPIVVPRAAPPLPAGFDAVDIAILDWIAAEARRLRQAAVLT